VNATRHKIMADSERQTANREWRIANSESRHRTLFRYSLLCIRNLIIVAVLLSTIAGGTGGCGEVSSLLNQIASLGGEIAGQRGRIRVLFINNTPLRAVFTFGTYDQTDQDSQPDFGQFGPNDLDVTLNGDAESDILSLTCARVFSIGSPRLLQLIEANLRDATVIDEAFTEGVEFYDVPSDDDSDADEGEFAFAGAAPAFEALLGVDFPCNSLLIIRFESDDLGPDPFRVDFELVPSESTR